MSSIDTLQGIRSSTTDAGSAEVARWCERFRQVPEPSDIVEVYVRNFHYRRDAETYATEIKSFPVRNFRVREVYKSATGGWNVEYESIAGAFGIGDRLVR